MFRQSMAAAALVVLSTGLSLAQYTGPIPNSGQDSGGINWYALPLIDRHAPQDVEREREIEQKYRETLRKIPDKKPSNDPWRSVRPAPTFDRHRPE
jgi:hypothetical protein